MKTLLRTLLWMAVIVWLGGLLFFPITAWAAFSTISDTHAAGTIVAKCLNVLHHEGEVASVLIILLLAIGRVSRVFQPGTAVVGIIVTLIMVGLTAFSQFVIIPKMESYRIAAGGAIDSVPQSDPRHQGFDRLHRTSERVEETVMFGGIILVILFARDGGLYRSLRD